MVIKTPRRIIIGVSNVIQVFIAICNETQSFRLSIAIR